MSVKRLVCLWNSNQPMAFSVSFLWAGSSEISLSTYNLILAFSAVRYSRWTFTRVSLECFSATALLDFTMADRSLSQDISFSSLVIVVFMVSDVLVDCD
ncbi:hypothetical protein D3C87_1691450 [compost metagenome]